MNYDLSVKLLSEELHRLIDDLSWLESEISRASAIVNDFENYYKFSMDALWHDYREPCEPASLDKILSLIEKYKNRVNEREMEIEELKSAINILSKKLT
jgi:hypothetical protein